jgi:hypothetical protein
LPTTGQLLSPGELLAADPGRRPACLLLRARPAKRRREELARLADEAALAAHGPLEWAERHGIRLPRSPRQSPRKRAPMRPRMRDQVASPPGWTDRSGDGYLPLGDIVLAFLERREERWTR